MIGLRSLASKPACRSSSLRSAASAKCVFFPALPHPSSPRPPCGVESSAWSKTEVVDDVQAAVPFERGWPKLETLEKDENPSGLGFGFVCAKEVDVVDGGGLRKSSSPLTAHTELVADGGGTAFKWGATSEGI